MIRALGIEGGGETLLFTFWGRDPIVCFPHIMVNYIYNTKDEDENTLIPSTNISFSFGLFFSSKTQADMDLEWVGVVTQKK